MDVHSFECAASEETAMKKLVLATLAAALLTFANAPTADAQRFPKAGYCPAGTCSNTGGSQARNIRNCSANNCRAPRGLGVSVKGNKRR